MYCKQIILSLLALGLTTGCVSTSQMEKEKQMREEQQRVYVDKFPVQNYEEYLALDKFTLDKYLPVGADKNNGTGFLTFFLRDGTKITYTIDDDLIYEVITNVKQPFIETYKRYYLDSKKLMVFSQTIDRIDVGEEKLYDPNGKVKEFKDHDKELKRKGMDYKKVLAWAEDMGFLDLKNARVLEGDKLSLSMFPLDDETIKDFKEDTDFSERDIKEFTKHKYVWSYIIRQDGGGHYYYVSADGEAYVDKGFSVYSR
jgi:hypothetical protein